MIYGEEAHRRRLASSPCISVTLRDFGRRFAADLLLALHRRRAPRHQTPRDHAAASRSRRDTAAAIGVPHGDALKPCAATGRIVVLVSRGAGAAPRRRLPWQSRRLSMIVGSAGIVWRCRSRGCPSCKLPAAAPVGEKSFCSSRASDCCARGSSRVPRTWIVPVPVRSCVCAFVPEPCVCAFVPEPHGPLASAFALRVCTSEPSYCQYGKRGRPPRASCRGGDSPLLTSE